MNEWMPFLLMSLFHWLVCCPSQTHNISFKASFKKISFFIATVCDLGYIWTPNRNKKIASLCIVYLNYYLAIFIIYHLNFMLGYKVSSFQMYWMLCLHRNDLIILKWLSCVLHSLTVWILDLRTAIFNIESIKPI